MFRVINVFFPGCRYLPISIVICQIYIGSAIPRHRLKVAPVTFCKTALVFFTFNDWKVEWNFQLLSMCTGLKSFMKEQPYFVSLSARLSSLKLWQNKKGQIFVWVAPKMVYFSQLPAVKTDTIFGGAQTNLGPSYFVRAWATLDIWSGLDWSLVEPYVQLRAC